MLIDIDPNFYAVQSPPHPQMTLRSRSWTLKKNMLKLYAQVFWASLFLNPEMDLVHMWYDDRY